MLYAVAFIAPKRTGNPLEKDYLMRFSLVTSMRADEVDTAYRRQCEFRLTFVELAAEEQDTC